jgi:hypothetical protein
MYNTGMSNTERVLDLLPGDVFADGYVVTGWPKVTDIGGRLVVLVNGHYGNNVLTTRRFLSNALVSVAPSC